MSEPELLHDRYRPETQQPKRWNRPGVLARDMENGKRVWVPDVRGYQEATLRATAERLHADPRFAIVSTSPLVLECPEAWSIDAQIFDDAIRLTVEEAVDATIELIELEVIASAAGARLLLPQQLWIDRAADQTVHARLIAPAWTSDTSAVSGHMVGELIGQVFGTYESGPRPARTVDVPPPALIEVLESYEPSAEKQIEALLPFAGDRARAMEARAKIARLCAAPAVRDFDLDLAIMLEEQHLAEDTTGDSHVTRKRRFNLGSLLHRRACFAIANGALERARTDLDRAIEVDQHPEHLTTSALLHERTRDHAAAKHAHDRAVAAIQVMASGNVEADPDTRESWPQKIARTLHARGAFRAKQKDYAGARADFEASLASHPTSAVRRALAKIADP